jgi:hypothetical protein
MIAKSKLSEDTLTGAYLLAEAEQQDFTDLEVITTEQYRYEQAIELAFSRGSTVDSIMEDAGTLFQTIPHCEFIEVFASKVRVVINADRIDDDVIQQSIRILTHVEEFVPGKRITFDELEYQLAHKST